MDVRYAEELRRRQDSLQVEAQEVIDELDLLQVLRHAGQPERVGSSVSGLMVWRDIDVSVLCRELTLERAFETVRPLLTNPRVSRAEYRNETGNLAPPDLGGDERYYFVLRYLTLEGAEWKIDLSFWLSDAPRGDVSYADRLRDGLNDEIRLTILWIKDVWHRRPSYPYEVGGFDVYTAVLQHGVRTPDEFESYLRERGLPIR